MNRKLSRNKDHRTSMMRNLATSLVLYEQVDTTEAKAKELKRYLETIIARHRDNSLTTRRSLEKIFFDPNAIKKMMEVLVPRFKDKKSGFIASYHLKNRIGDNSPMMRLVVIGKDLVDTAPAKPEKEDKPKKEDQE